MQEEAVASFRLSPQQEQEWLREPEGPSGRNQVVVRIGGPVDAAKLRDAFRATAERHEILRTTFQRRTGMRVPLQVVNETLGPHWDERAVETSELERVAEEERSAAFPFDAGPLARAVLVQLAPEDHALVLTLPSVCADANALATLTGDIVAQYGDVPVADEPLQYADFAEWQHSLRESGDEVATTARTFWAAFEPGMTPAVPFLRRVATPKATQRHAVALSEATRAHVERRARQYGVGPELFVLAAWQVLLARLSGEQEVEVTAILPERHYSDLESAVGAFQRAVPVRLVLSERSTFAEALDRAARASAESATSHDHLPDADWSHVGFVAPAPLERRDAAGATFAAEDVFASSSGSSLLLVWARTASLAFDPAAFDSMQAERLADRFARVLEAVTADPSLVVDEIDLLGDLERREVLFDFNTTTRDIPTTTIDALVRDAIARRPTQTAVVDSDGSISYADLDARVNGVAAQLKDLGVEPGSVVGLCTDRSIDMVVGLLGILRAGAAYLPLHYEHPRARLLHQLHETDAKVVVTQSPLVEGLAGFAGSVLRLDEPREGRASVPVAPANASPDDLVYVIYTSGSTGTPKGVGVTNKNLVNYVTSIRERVGADEEPLRFGVVTAISTDLGNTSVFTALCSGGTLSLISPATAGDPGALTHWLTEHPVDVLKITPSHLGALLVGADAAQLLPRKWLIVGGEACSWDLVARVRELSDCRILNHYGPTETTVGSCTYLVDDGPGLYAPATVPIGRPIANTACYVLDARQVPVPVGVVGSLYIAGAGVARGYVAQEKLTADRFVCDPFEAAAGGRMYATGDRARWLPDGTLEFFGRVDEQIKIRGFRVEPSEVESVLLRASGVREAAVVPRQEANGELRLAAYIVADATVSDLRAHAADYLPEFMVPSAFVMLDQLPRTPSGKIDRQNLPDPEAAAGPPSHDYVAPRTPMEEKIAAIWEDVLGVERVGVHDDFFALGGHSLLATQIIAQLRSDFGVDLPLHSLFTDPTVESLSAVIFGMLAETGGEDTDALLAELEGLSDEEAARLLAEDGS